MTWSRVSRKSAASKSLRRCSHWSEPIEFVAGTPDLQTFDALVISEILYHPGTPSDEELTAGFRREPISSSLSYTTKETRPSIYPRCVLPKYRL